jgi:hypothetical protein
MQLVGGWLGGDGLSLRGMWCAAKPLHCNTISFVVFEKNLQMPTQSWDGPAFKPSLVVYFRTGGEKITGVYRVLAV